MRKTKIGFVYDYKIVDVTGNVRDEWRVENIIPDEGIEYILGAALDGDSQFSTWYVGLYGNNRLPVAGDTMALLLADAGEITSYSGGARKTLVPTTVDGVWAGAELSFVFTAGTTVRGGFITSNSVHGNTTGLLLSAELNPTPKVLATGETLKVTAGLSMVTV